MKKILALSLVILTSFSIQSMAAPLGKIKDYSDLRVTLSYKNNAQNIGARTSSIDSFWNTDKGDFSWVLIAIQHEQIGGKINLLKNQHQLDIKNIGDRNKEIRKFYDLLENSVNKFVLIPNKFQVNERPHDEIIITVMTRNECSSCSFVFKSYDVLNYAKAKRFWNHVRALFPKDQRDMPKLE